MRKCHLAETRNRAESKNDFVHKIGIVEKEALETQMWLKVIGRTWNMRELETEKFHGVMREASEFVALFTSISKRAKGN